MLDTSQVLLQTKIFNQYLASIPGAFVNETYGLIQIPRSSYSQMGTLTFTIGGVDYTLLPSQQIYPIQIFHEKPPGGYLFGEVGGFDLGSGPGPHHLQVILYVLHYVVITCTQFKWWCYTEVKLLPKDIIKM